MSNVLDATGLTVNSVTEIVADLTTQLQAVYGADINVDQNSPDGQLINIFAQASADQLELLVDIYNSFAVENAFGVDLDQRVAINGLARRAGTFTTTPVLITVNQALNLIGLDEIETNPTAQVFTIKDDAGNQWVLAENHTFSGAGATSLTFRAVTLGAVEVIANTITNQVTTVLGVTAVNNPTVSGTILGVNEESDADLKIRHGRMFYLASTGPSDAVAAALLSIPDVIDAFVGENVTDTPSGGIPAHGIWCIVNGGSDANIAQAIYSKKGAGCDMVGAETFVITRPQGNSITIKWDAALTQDLFIQFGVTPRSGTIPTDADIKTALAAALVYKLGQIATIGDVVAAMLAIVPNAYITGVGVSDDGMSYGDTATPSDLQHYWTVSTANIDIT